MSERMQSALAREGARRGARVFVVVCATLALQPACEDEEDDTPPLSRNDAGNPSCCEIFFSAGESRDACMASAREGKGPCPILDAGPSNVDAATARDADLDAQRRDAAESGRPSIEDGASSSLSDAAVLDGMVAVDAALDCNQSCAWGCSAGVCDDAVEVIASGGDACARRKSGRVACWGLGPPSDNLGAGTARATTVVAVADAVQLGVGLKVGGCVLRATGRVVCWDYTPASQVADAGTEAPFFATEVSGLVDAVEISVGISHACARRASGSVACWGLGDSGQLGNGMNTSSITPVDVVGLTNATGLATGLTHSCARRGDGTVSCWGSNASGQLGNNSTTPSAQPVQVADLSDAAEISAGRDHTCARLQSGSVSCWGSNEFGQLGRVRGGALTPTPIAGVAGVTQLAAGRNHTCARLEGGNVMCWGSDSTGQLGDGAVTSGPASVLVASLSDAVQVTSGINFSCARRVTGAVVCWGTNLYGQLGDGSRTETPSPTTVLRP